MVFKVTHCKFVMSENVSKTSAHRYSPFFSIRSLFYIFTQHLPVRFLLQTFPLYSVEFAFHNYLTFAILKSLSSYYPLEYIHHGNPVKYTSEMSAHLAKRRYTYSFTFLCQCSSFNARSFNSQLMFTHDTDCLRSFYHHPYCRDPGE